MNNYFINRYEVDDNEFVDVAYWETPKGYFFCQSEKGKKKRISIIDYVSAWEYHYNY